MRHVYDARIPHIGSDRSLHRARLGPYIGATADTGHESHFLLALPAERQQPSATTFDESKLTFIAQFRPAFHEGQTYKSRSLRECCGPHQRRSRHSISASEWSTALSVRFVKRRVTTVPYVVELSKSRPLTWSRSPPSWVLRFNDIISGTIVMQRDEKMPDAILAATRS